eukprot:355471-Chlamydomonas_euryale.AAC.14
MRTFVQAVVAVRAPCGLLNSQVNATMFGDWKSKSADLPKHRLEASRDGAGEKELQATGGRERRGQGRRTGCENDQEQDLKSRWAGHQSVGRSHQQSSVEIDVQLCKSIEGWGAAATPVWRHEGGGQTVCLTLTDSYFGTYRLTCRGGDGIDECRWDTFWHIDAFEPWGLDEPAPDDEPACDVKTSSTVFKRVAAVEVLTHRVVTLQACAASMRSWCVFVELCRAAIRLQKQVFRKRGGQCRLSRAALKLVRQNNGCRKSTSTAS